MLHHFRIHPIKEVTRRWCYLVSWRAMPLCHFAQEKSSISYPPTPSNLHIRALTQFRKPQSALKLSLHILAFVFTSSHRRPLKMCSSHHLSLFRLQTTIISAVSEATTNLLKFKFGRDKLSSVETEGNVRFGDFEVDWKFYVIWRSLKDFK